MILALLGSCLLSISPLEIELSPKEILELHEASLRSSLEQFLKEDWPEENRGLLAEFIFRKSPIVPALLSFALLWKAFKGRFPWSRAQRPTCEKSLSLISKLRRAPALLAGLLIGAIEGGQILAYSPPDPEELWLRRNLGENLERSKISNLQLIAEIHENCLKRLNLNTEIQFAPELPQVLFEGIALTAKIGDQQLRLKVQRDAEGKIKHLLWTSKI